jgi:hypothetical protein
MPMHTFLLRVWSADGEPPPAELHGVLERAGSHEPRPFREGAELLSLLLEGLRFAAAESDGSGQGTARATAQQRPEGEPQ